MTGARRSSPARVTTRGRRPRGSLGQDDILTAAGAIVADGGLSSLSMSVLAERLDSGVTSIYWHLRSKEALLVALAQRATAEMYRKVPEPPAGLSWDDQLMHSFLGFRRSLHSSPVCLELYSVRPRFVSSSPNVFPLVMQSMERDATALVRAGFAPQKAVLCLRACANYTGAFVFLEHGERRMRAHERASPDERPWPPPGSIDATEFPLLAQLPRIDVLVALDDEHFERGLRLLLDGVRASFGGRPSST